MAERSVEVTVLAHQSIEKFDYFICGLAGALFAYIGEHYSPRKLDFGISALEPMALFFLASSFLFGLKRIEWNTCVKKVNAAMLDAAEKAGSTIEVLSKPRTTGVYINSETGDAYDAEALRRRHAVYLKQRADLEPTLNKAMRKANRYYEIRDILLLLGFLMIFLAKILQPYSE